MKRMLLLAILLEVLRPFAAAQEPSCVLVTSWRRGAEVVSGRTLRITLGPNQSGYATDIVGTGGGRYRLEVIHNPIPEVKMEHWQVSLRKFQRSRSKVKGTIGPNLLTAEGPGPGKHHFPREDSVGYLYPHDDPPITVIGGVAFIEGHFFYPIRATRYIKVEGFCLMLKVEDFRRNKSDGRKVDYLSLTAEFLDACPSEACKDRQ